MTVFNLKEHLVGDGDIEMVTAVVFNLLQAKALLALGIPRETVNNFRFFEKDGISFIDQITNFFDRIGFSYDLDEPEYSSQQLALYFQHDVDQAAAEKLLDSEWYEFRELGNEIEWLDEQTICFTVQDLFECPFEFFRKFVDLMEGEN